MLTKLRIMLTDFLAVIGHSWDLDQKRKWYGTYSDKPDGVWDKTAEDMMLEIAETIHPLFRASSALERGELRSKGRGKKTIHFHGSEQNVELILLTVMSCESAQYLRSSSRHMHGGIQRYHGFRETRSTCSTRSFGNDGNSHRTSLCRPSDWWAATGNLLQEYEQQFEQLSDDQKLSKLCSNAGLKTFERGTTFHHTWYRRTERNGAFMQRIYAAIVTIWARARGWIRKNAKIGPVLNVHVCHHEDRYSIEIQVRSLFQDRTASWVRIVNGVERYVNDTTETMEDEEHEASGKPIAEARPRMKSTISLTPVSVPLRERKWVDVNPGSYDHECFVVSKAMIWLVRPWSEYSSGNRRSNQIWRYCWRIQQKEKEKNRGCFAMVTQWLDFYSGKRRRSQEKVSILLEP